MEWNGMEWGLGGACSVRRIRARVVAVRARCVIDGVTDIHEHTRGLRAVGRSSTVVPREVMYINMFGCDRYGYTVLNNVDINTSLTVYAPERHFLEVRTDVLRVRICSLHNERTETAECGDDVAHTDLVASQRTNRNGRMWR